MKILAYFISIAVFLLLIATIFFCYYLSPYRYPGNAIFYSPFLKDKVIALSIIGVPTRGEDTVVNWIKTHRYRQGFFTLKELTKSDDPYICMWSLYLIADVYPLQAKEIAAQFSDSSNPKIKKVSLEIVQSYQVEGTKGIKK